MMSDLYEPGSSTRDLLRLAHGAEVLCDGSGAIDTSEETGATIWRTKKPCPGCPACRIIRMSPKIEKTPIGGYIAIEPVEYEVPSVLERMPASWRPPSVVPESKEHPKLPEPKGCLGKAATAILCVILLALFSAGPWFRRVPTAERTIKTSVNLNGGNETHITYPWVENTLSQLQAAFSCLLSGDYQTAILHLREAMRALFFTSSNEGLGELTSSSNSELDDGLGKNQTTRKLEPGAS